MHALPLYFGQDAVHEISLLSSHESVLIGDFAL